MDGHEVSHGELLERVDAVKLDVARAFRVGIMLFGAAASGMISLTGFLVVLHADIATHTERLTALPMIDQRVRENSDRLTRVEATRFTGEHGAALEARLSERLEYLRKSVQESRETMVSILARLPPLRNREVP